MRDASEPKVLDRSVLYTPGPASPLDLTADLDPGTHRPLRSGSFKNFLCPSCEDRARLWTAAREVLPPTDAYNDTGIRCARSYPD